MAVLTRTALVAALVLSYACQRSPTLIDIPHRSISVHAVLVAGSDSATVLVTRPASSASVSQSTAPEPITNAHVRLVHGADIVVADYHARPCLGTLSQPDVSVAGIGCYTAHVPGGVRAGATYDLLVDIAGELPIRGSTRVPSPPQILEPAPLAEPLVVHVSGPALPRTTFIARWSGAGDDARTELRFITDRSDCTVIIANAGGFFGLDHFVVTGVDSATVTVGSVHCAQALAERYAARFVITVYDENYSSYLDRSTEGERLNRSAGIAGALGVFGAAASSAVPIVLEHAVTANFSRE